MTRSPILRSLALAAGLLFAADAALAAQCPAYLDHDFRKLRSRESVNLCEAYAGKPLLIVNTASHCGYTKQFSGLEALYQKYKGRGLVVIGFPSDDFKQEAKDEAEAAEICYGNYGVTFTMLSVSSVKGATANPVFRDLIRQSREPSWNFNKYLVDADGKVVKYFESKVTPESPELAQAIESLLK